MTGFLVAAAASLMTAGSTASACDVHGKVVCATDANVPVSGIGVILSSAPDANTNWVGETVTAFSGIDGTFDTFVNGWGQTYDVNLTTADYYCGPTSPSIYIAPIAVDSDQCPGTPSCVPTIPVQFPYCPARPIGNPRAECALFGLTVLDKVEGVSSVATTDADLALIKAGSCYGIALGVTAGDPLTSPNDQAISHVTYCVCN